MTFLLFCASTVLAQDDKEEQKAGRYVAKDRALHAEDTSVVRGKEGVGWVRSHLLDSWFLQLQGGGQLYYGTDDREGAFGDRLTGNAEFQIGRRIFPMFGFRLGGGIGYAHGFIEKETYNTHTITFGDGTGEHGDGLNGYYYDYDENLLIQKWKYFYYGADLFLDLAIFRGTKEYDPFKHWNNIIYLGVHNKYSLSDILTPRNHRSEIHAGYVGKYNFSTGWSVYGDFRFSLMERLFDREWVSGIERSGFALDPILNVQVGLMYKFHFRTSDERSTFVHRENETLVTNVKTYTTYIRKTEEIYHYSLIDTLLAYSQQNVDTPEMQAKKDSIRALIDADKNRGKRAADGMPLDSILLKNLLPYEMVFFELDRWEILPTEEMKIDKMARIMKAYPNETFILTGSADSKTGTVNRNIFLSHHRADTVYTTLVEKYGINPSQLKREYLGGILEYKPFQLNRTTVIIMDHPAVRRAFEEMKKEGQAGGGEVEIKD